MLLFENEVSSRKKMSIPDISSEELRHRMVLDPFVLFTKKRTLKKVKLENGFLVSILTGHFDINDDRKRPDFYKDYLNALIHYELHKSTQKLASIMELASRS